MNRRQNEICGCSRRERNGPLNCDKGCFGLIAVSRYSLTVLVWFLGTFYGPAQSRWQIQNPNLNGITFSNGKFMAVGQDGAVWTSTDAVSWNQQWSGTRSWLAAVTYGGGTFVAVGGPNGPTQGPSILSSMDGASWQARSSSFALIGRE